MKKYNRYFLLVFYLICSLGLFYFFYFIVFPIELADLLFDWTLYPLIFFFLLSINEFYSFCKIGRRSELSDIVAIALFFFVIFFITKDLLTSIMGAFSIYLWVGIIELREYPVINKILIISLVTYNVIFIAGLVSFYYEDPFYINTAFAFSFWIILGLGFLLFGRKYIVVWRFLSPAYLLLFLYIIAWLAVIFINQYTPINFIYDSPLSSDNIHFMDFFLNIYFILIVVNWIVYFLSGAVLDKLLGIKKVDDENFLKIVENVKNDIGIKGKVKVGFGRYPILNAMAYGAFFDKRIAIIAEDMDQIPEYELKGIVAHELAHTKGKYTLILTFIATIDLTIRMLLGIPATYYDYTFSDPKIPMIGFIFLNIVLYMFFFIFIRFLEGKADLKAKKSGYAKELAKALYNLESYYATGREFGLNTMLLCKERITKDNQLLDYMDTADYIHQSMILPKRGSLLANLMNSHPPTYFRIAALLGEELKPGKEALLPFICLKRSKQKKYAKKFEKARFAFKIIANEKFKEYFKVENVSLLLENLRRREIYESDFEKDYIFKNKITDEIIFGKLEDVQFLDDICDTDQYIITDLKTSQKLHLNTSLYTKMQVNLNSTYFFKKNTPMILSDIELNIEKIGGNYVFLDKDSNKILKPITKTKLPISVDNIKKFKDHEIFLKLKGELKIYRCTNVISTEIFNDYELEFSVVRQESLNFKLSELIIRPRNIYFSISRNVYFRKYEIELFNWLLNNQLRVFIYLKKPVNNLEIGKILKLNVNFEGIEKDFIIVKNIFGKKINIPYKLLELIAFKWDTAMIQKKSETSMFSRLGFKILNKFKPEKVLYQ